MRGPATYGCKSYKGWLIVSALALACASQAASHTQHKLYVDNTSGHTVTVIDLDSRKVLHNIDVGKSPHGLGALPDGSRVFVSVESDHTLKVIDPRTDSILTSVPLDGRPNQLAVTPDGRWIYVAINDKDIADVVDARNLQIVKQVPVGRAPHNCYCPGSKRYIYVTAIDGQVVRQYDYAHGHQLVQTIHFDGPVRPLCVTHDDKRLFVALYNLHGFAWADLGTGREVERVERPLPPPNQRSKFAYMNTHGLELRPGDGELWVTSFIGSALMIYDVTGREPRYVTSVPVGDAPNWLTFSANGRYAYSANAGDNSITIVDCQARRRLADVKVGPVPKRVLEVDLPVQQD